MRYFLILFLGFLSFWVKAQSVESFGSRFIISSDTLISGSDDFYVRGLMRHPRATYSADSVQINDILVDADCNFFTVDSILTADGNYLRLRVTPADTTVNDIRTATGGIIRLNSPPNGTYTLPAGVPSELIDCFINYNFQNLTSVSNLNDLDDVDTTGIVANDLLQWNGTDWIMSSPAEVIPTIYNADDTITSNRTVEIGANTLAFVSNNAASDAVQFYQVNGSNWNNSYIGYQRLYWDVGDIDSEAYQTIYTTQIRNKVQTPDGYVDYRINDTTADYRLHNGSADLWALFSPTGFSLSPTTYTTPTAMLDIAGDIRVRSLPSDVAPTGVVTADANGNFTSSTPAQVVSAGGAPTGSGVANRVTYWSGASTLTSDAGFTHTNGVLTIRPSSLNANDPQIVAIAQTSSYAYLDIKASSPGWDSQVRWYTNDPGTLNWSLGSDGGSTNDLVLRNEFRNKDFIRLGNASTPTVTFDLHNPGKYRFLSGSFGIGVTPSYTLDVTTGGLRLGAEGSDITGVAGVLEYYGWFKGHDGSAWNFLPKADAASWTNQYIPYSNGSRLTTDATGAFQYKPGPPANLYLNGSTDNGFYYALEINGGYGLYATGSSYINGYQVSANIFKVNNTHPTGWGAEITSSGTTGLSVTHNNASGVPLYIGTRTNTVSFGVVDAIRIGMRIEPVQASGSYFLQGGSLGSGVGAGRPITWLYGQQGGATNCRAQNWEYNAARIAPLITASECDTISVGLYFYARYGLSFPLQFLINEGTLTAPYYGDNTITGTPSTWAAWDINGKFIETTAADIVSAGGALTGSGAANRVAYWNGTSTLTSNAGFTYNGTDLAVTTGTISSSTDVKAERIGLYNNADASNSPSSWIQERPSTTHRIILYNDLNVSGQTSNGFIISPYRDTTTNRSGTFAIWSKDYDYYGAANMYATGFNLDATGELKIYTDSYGTYTKKSDIYFATDGTIELLRLTGDGGVLINPLTGTTPTGSEGMLYADADDNNLYYHDGTAFRQILMDADFTNGLTFSSGQVKLGGALTGTTSLTGAYQINISGDVSSAAKLTVTNNGSSGVGISSSTTSGNAFYGVSTNSYAAYLQSTNGYGAFVYSTNNTALYAGVNPSSTNSVVDVMNVQRTTSGTAANGIGGAINYLLQTSGGSTVTAVKLEAIWDDATTATRTSDFVVTLKDSTVSFAAMTIKGDRGIVELNTGIRENIQTEVNSATTATLFNILPVDVSSGTVTISVPTYPAPQAGDWFAVSDSRANAGSNNITVSFTGASVNFHGASADDVISSNGEFRKYTYVNSTVGWIRTN